MKVTQHRTQMLLDSESYLWLKRRAQEKDVSIARVVREVIDKERKKEKQKKRERYSKAYRDLLSLAGKGKKGPSDVSVNHDVYLGEWLYKEKIKVNK